MVSIFRSLNELNLVITVPSDGLAPNGARPSEGTVLTTKWDIHNIYIKYWAIFIWSNMFKTADAILWDSAFQELTLIW